jgi:hypothetical protein
VGVDWIHLAQDRAQYRNLGFHKRRKRFWLVEWLLVSQGRFCSMELVSFINYIWFSILLWNVFVVVVNYERAESLRLDAHMTTCRYYKFVPAEMSTKIITELWDLVPQPVFAYGETFIWNENQSLVGDALNCLRVVYSVDFVFAVMKFPVQ